MMKYGMMVRFQAVVVLCVVVLAAAEEEYESRLTKLWSVKGTGSSDGSAVLNVPSGSVGVQASSYSSAGVPRSGNRVESRYAFKPRAIPLRADPQSQVERNVYYSPDNAKRHKPDMLFPGNYNRIAKEKRNGNVEESRPVEVEKFHPKAIPLIRSEEAQKRSLDEDTEPIVGDADQSASRRSISYLFGNVDEEEEDRDDDLETEEEADDGKEGFKSKVKKPKIKKSKLKKYVIPLLLAYKMKYFAMVPVLIGGLILLVGATGLAGFFFALFAAVMGLQKGGY